MDKKICEISDAREESRNTITTIAAQGPLSFRTEEGKVKFPYNAVVGNDWCKVFLTQRFAQNPPCNFNQLFTALDTACLQEQSL